MNKCLSLSKSEMYEELRGTRGCTNYSGDRDPGEEMDDESNEEDSQSFLT